MEHQLPTFLPESLDSTNNIERLNQAFAEGGGDLIEGYLSLSEIFRMTSGLDGFWPGHAYDALLNIIRNGCLPPFFQALESLDRTGDLTHQMCSSILLADWEPSSTSLAFSNDFMADLSQATVDQVQSSPYQETLVLAIEILFLSGPIDDILVGYLLRVPEISDVLAHCFDVLQRDQIELSNQLCLMVLTHSHNLSALHRALNMLSLSENLTYNNAQYVLQEVTNPEVAAEFVIQRNPITYSQNTSSEQRRQWQYRHGPAGSE